MPSSHRKMPTRALATLLIASLVMLLAAAQAAARPRPPRGGWSVAGSGAVKWARSWDQLRSRRQVRRSTVVQPDVQVVQTTSDLLERLAPLPGISFSKTRIAGIPVIHVDSNVRYQRFTGVGGAMTDTAAWLIQDQLSAPARAFLMDALFGADGIRLGFIRVPMGASDFTVGRAPYSYDDMPAGQSDPGLASFSIAHDQAYIIPALREALAVNPAAEILAEPWSPPSWMKANQAPNNAQHIGTLLPSAFAPLADYIVKFIQAYAASGIPISAITPQNEPHAATAYPGMELTEPDEARLIAEDLAPALSAAGLHPKIYGGDLGWGLPTYPQALISSEARGALTGIAWHCYGADPSVLSALHAAAPGLDQIVSECAPGIIPYPVAEVLIGSLREWASAVAFWNLALDQRGGPVQLPNVGCFGCTGLVTISERTHSVGFTLAYYQLGQVSQFVSSGAVRIATGRLVDWVAPEPGNDGVSQGLDDVAFLNPDGTKVLIVYNNAPLARRFGVKWRSRAFGYTLAPAAMVTFVWR
ncbi:MAG TPA: glycoside hydrolase family 30 beta sandwich domain-containing protein [Solirubrobacteraceae bacterium]|nr:glycoside hydrolase family 30 beta sandwich domain-containing protein [Solirubrobacteraceae bacterium]